MGREEEGCHTCKGTDIATVRGQAVHLWRAGSVGQKLRADWRSRGGEGEEGFHTWSRRRQDKAARRDAWAGALRSPASR
jgi:hypothetical protein